MTTILMSVLVMSANSAEKEFDASKFKYFEKIMELYGENYRFDIEYTYNELYYHYSDENQEEPDWALIFCEVRSQPVQRRYGTVVGNRVLAIVGGGCVRLDYGYGVYIKETDSIVSLTQDSLNQIIELCPDFVKAIEENNIGQSFGDMNNDGIVDVVDATYIQRYLADHYDYYQYIYNDVTIGAKSGVMISDFDRDGETTILDATKIQRHIAGLE